MSINDHFGQFHQLAIEVVTSPYLSSNISTVLYSSSGCTIYYSVILISAVQYFSYPFCTVPLGEGNWDFSIYNFRLPLHSFRRINPIELIFLRHWKAFNPMQFSCPTRKQVGISKKPKLKRSQWIFMILWKELLNKFGLWHFCPFQNNIFRTSKNVGGRSPSVSFILINDINDNKTYEILTVPRSRIEQGALKWSLVRQCFFS